MDKNRKKVFIKEIAISTLNGFIFAILTSLATILWFNDPLLAVIVGAAMTINIFSAGLFGFLIPYSLNYFKIDPALASSVFVTTVTDVFGFLSFLGLASLKHKVCLMGGSLAVNKRVFKYVEKANKITGLRLGPDDAYLIIRGLRTLDVRLDKHQENAKKVASFLSKHKKVKLLYPFKNRSYNFKMWKKYYSGASGLMGMTIKAKNKRSVTKFVNSLKLFGYGYSWGGFESLALQQEFRELGNRKFLRLAKNEHLVRLHIGLEDPKDLIQDLKRSLKLVK